MTETVGEENLCPREAPFPNVCGFRIPSDGPETRGQVEGCVVAQEAVWLRVRSLSERQCLACMLHTCCMHAISKQHCCVTAQQVYPKGCCGLWRANVESRRLPLEPLQLALLSRPRPGRDSCILGT